jgi:hypothetical protein
MGSIGCQENQYIPPGTSVKDGLPHQVEEWVILWIAVYESQGLPNHLRGFQPGQLSDRRIHPGDFPMGIDLNHPAESLTLFGKICCPKLLFLVVRF